MSEENLHNDFWTSACFTGLSPVELNFNQLFKETIVLQLVSQRNVSQYRVTVCLRKRGQQHHCKKKSFIVKAKTRQDTGRVQTLHFSLLCCMHQMYNLLPTALAETQSNAYTLGSPLVCYDVDQFVLVLSDQLLTDGSDESRSKSIAGFCKQTLDFCLKMNRNETLNK